MSEVKRMWPFYRLYICKNTLFFSKFLSIGSRVAQNIAQNKQNLLFVPLMPELGQSFDSLLSIIDKDIENCQIKSLFF